MGTAEPPDVAAPSALAAFRLAAARADVEARSTALAGHVEELAEQQALTTHDDEHDPEGVTIAVERAQLLGLLAGAQAEIASLGRAEARLAAGTYGRCLTCGCAIPEARLEALPAAEACLDCAGRRRREPGVRRS